MHAGICAYLKVNILCINQWGSTRDADARAAEQTLQNGSYTEV